MQKSLYVKLSIFFLLILTISSLIYQLVTTSLTNTKNINTIINDVGRERILSEKINKKAMRLALLDDQKTENDIIFFKYAFESNLNKIKKEMESFSPSDPLTEELNTDITTIEEKWLQLKVDIDQLLSDKGDQISTIRRIETKSEEILHPLENIVYILEKEDNKTLQGLTTENLILHSFSLIFIIILFVIWRLLVSLSKSEKKYRLLAIKDHLTQLMNRREFEKKLQQKIDKQESVAVFFLDLDRFKYVNDSLGHSVGDKLIQLVADRLRKIVGDEDSAVCRLGGDEFTILLECTDKNCISNFAKEIIDEIKLPYIIDEKELLITCSIGISIYPDHGNNIETLMKCADVAMYLSKENGKNDYSIYQDHMIEKSAEILELELELRKAIEHNEFELYYQPKVDLYTQEIVGCEALIRWNHPTKGIIPPSTFIPLAEETGLINPIGEWVLKEACRQGKKLHEAGYSGLQIAVNVSVHQLKQVNFVGMVKSILMENQLEPRFLELEITESISMLSKSNKIKKLYDLKEIGVSLAIDDFGTGYSSLKYLTKLPVDTLKIDKSFIDEIGKSNHFTSLLMVDAIITLAKSLNLEVIAEGIETEEQMNYLNKHDCDVGQGYFISKPLPMCKLEVFLYYYSHQQIEELKHIGDI